MLHPVWASMTDAGREVAERKRAPRRPATVLSKTDALAVAEDDANAKATGKIKRRRRRDERAFESADALPRFSR
jgi:hypothetical protein